MSQNEVTNPPDKLATKYIISLCLELQDKLNGFYYSSPDQMIPKAEEFEAQLARIAS